MNHRYLHRFRHRVVMLTALLAIAFSWNGSIRPVGAEAAPAVKQFHLYATDGYMKLPDGQQVYVWGYSLKNEQGSAGYPAPTLEVNEGDSVEVTLTNIGPLKKGIKQLAHTIHWHGLDTDQQNDGVPHTSPAIQVGESFTYRFTADHAGTYFYHCHVDTIEHLQMGMDGAFVVKAKDGANQAWTGGPAYDKEYVFVLNEIDPVWHKAVEEGKPYDRTNFHPTYWTINGKAYPDTEKDPSTSIEGKVGQTVLVRMVNAGYQPHSFHMHGYHFQVVASDGRALPNPQTKDTILIGPGERYDLLVTFDHDGMYPFHSHNIVDNTNNGVYPGGLHTMVDVGSGTNPVSTKTITLKAGQAAATVDGAVVQLPVAPAAIGGSTYVPLRFLADQWQADVKWNEKEQSAVYTTADKSVVQLWLNTKQAKVDGKLINLTAAPQRMKGSIMVPVRFASEQLGAALDYDKKTGVISLTATIQAPAPDAGGMDPHQGAHDHGGATDGTTPTPDAGSGGASGGTNGGSNGGTVDGSLTVEINNGAFSIKKLTVKKGQTVTWVNKDSQIHTVYDLNDAFRSKNLLPGDSFTHTFNETGTFTYYCSTHPTMYADIEVTE